MRGSDDVFGPENPLETPFQPTEARRDEAVSGVWTAAVDAPLYGEEIEPPSEDTEPLTEDATPTELDLAPEATEWESLPAYGLIEHHHSCGCAACSHDREDPLEGSGEATGGTSTGTVGVLSDMADFLISGYWNTGYGDGSRSHNVTDSGIDANDGVLHFNLSGYSADADGISAARATLVREAFKLFEATLGIEFVETSSTDTGVVDFFFRDNDSGAYASHGYWNSGTWGSTITSAQINVASSWSGGTSTYDDYTLQTILHEIGHALGLGHQGPYNGSATWGSSNIYDNDSWQASMMSYFSQTQASGVTADYEFLQTPMAVDWLALDELYGRQGYGVSNAFTENTVWGFNTTVTSAVSDIWASWSDWADRTASTIVDGGGTDTLDLSGYSDNTLINLMASDPGSSAPATSNIGGRVGNLTIAAGSVIENAIGGAGAETFYGNGADNTLTGNGGNDTFHDSDGEDSYVGGSGTDSVIFGLSFADYTYSIVGGVLQVIGAAVDWIDDTVEWLTFSDQTLSWQAIADGAAVNADPVANDDSYTVNEDQALAGSSVLANDTDGDGDALQVALVEGVAVGTAVTLASGAQVTMSADGTFDYDQNGAFDALAQGQTATDSFTYRATDGTGQSEEATVTVTIRGASDNSAPDAVLDRFTLYETATVTGSVLSNDTDGDGDTLTVTALNGSGQLSQTLASGAQVTLNANGTFTYDANGAFDALDDGETATDSFTYRISDGEGGTDTATVRLTIEGVSPPMSSDVVKIGFENQPTGSFDAAHGLSLKGLKVLASDALSGGKLGSSGQNGTFSITADGEDFDVNGLTLLSAAGRQTVTVEAYDDGARVGSRSVTVGADKPVELNLAASFDNVDRFVVTGAAEVLVDDLALVTRTALDLGENLAPDAVGDMLSTSERAPVQGNLLDNDRDLNGDTIELLSINGVRSGPVTLASGAIITFDRDGDITYDPNGAFDGLGAGQSAREVFTYGITDRQGSEAETVAWITISGGDGQVELLI